MVVIGNAALDRVFSVQELPRPGETLLARSSERRLGGKGVNQAVAAARAGAAVRFVAGVGSDPEGDAIARYLEAEGVESVLVRGPGATDKSVVMVASDGENAIVSTANQAHSLPLRSVDKGLEAIAPGGILLLQGNPSPSTTRHALERGRACQLVRIANAAPVAFAWDELQLEIDVLIVNSIEAGLVGPLRSGAVIVTEGASGATLIQASQRWRVPAPVVAAVDTTGAGDVLCGVFAAALDRGLPMLGALEGAVRAAALKVTRAGLPPGCPLPPSCGRSWADLPTTDHSGGCHAGGSVHRHRVQRAHQSAWGPARDAREDRCGARTIVNEPLQVPPANLEHWLAEEAAAPRHIMHVQGDQIRQVDLLSQARDRGLLFATHTTHLAQEWRSPVALARLCALFDIVILNREVARNSTRSRGGTAELVRDLQPFADAAEDDSPPDPDARGGWRPPAAQGRTAAA